MVATKLYTADDLLAMGPDAPYELINGELVEVSPSSSDSTFVTYYLSWHLGNFVVPRKLGLVSSAEGGWQLRHDPDTVVAPDIGFIRAERVPKPRPPDRFLDVAPDLAVEVRSPSNRAGQVRRKVQLYAEAGVPLVWVVDPITRTVTVHRLGEPPVTLHEGETLDGGDVVPGFAIPVAEIFADPLA